jgi:hypothetical protein
MAVTPEKFTPIEVPTTPERARQLAEEREAWARLARDSDRWGSVKEFEFTARLLRDLAERL